MYVCMYACMHVCMHACMYVCVYARMYVCMVWYGMVWYGMVWYGMVWYGMVWYGMVWYGMVWYGMVCMYVRMYEWCTVHEWVCVGVSGHIWDTTSRARSTELPKRTERRSMQGAPSLFKASHDWRQRGLWVGRRANVRVPAALVPTTASSYVVHMQRRLAQHPSVSRSMCRAFLPRSILFYLPFHALLLLLRVGLQQW